MRKVKLSEILDKLVLLAAMLLFTYVGVTAIRETQFIDSLAGRDRPLLNQMSLNAPRYAAEAPPVNFENWAPAASQSRGKEWVFDVFTPPVIYYDPHAQEFAVTPPNLEGADDAGLWARFDLELLEVRPRPYRLQLVGYAGEPGNYVAYLERIATGEILLVREGEELPDFEARLVGFEVRLVENESEDSMPVLQPVGIARLMDYTTQQELSLTNLETKMFSDLEARVRMVQDGVVHLVKAGSRLELDSSVYVISDLSAQPEEALVIKLSKDGARRLSKTLVPISNPELKPRSRQGSEAADSPFAIRPSPAASRPQG